MAQIPVWFAVWFGISNAACVVVSSAPAIDRFADAVSLTFRCDSQN